MMPAGSTTFNFDASGLSSGVYIYRLISNSSVITKKMTLINAGTISGDFSPGCTLIDFNENMIYGSLFEGSNLQLSKSQNLHGENYTIWENTETFNGKWDPVTLF